ncbi:WD repeat domain 60 [Pitangus sulphuratus]|nr:WD repeat domain 60 [Pitangus sulphuratus]
MEGDKASQPDSQNEVQKHREKKLLKDRSVLDTDTHKHERRDRGKSKERTRERERLKSSERDRDKMRERGKEHQRGDPERYKDKLQESHLEKERYSVHKHKDRESDREGDKKHKRHEIKQTDTQNNLKSFEEGDKKHHRRRESRHRLEEEKTRSEERERRHKEKKDNDARRKMDKFLAYKVEGDRVHKSERDQELDKEGERRHREKKEHSVGPEKEKLSKERSHKRHGKEEEEKHKSRRSKEESSHGDREGQAAEVNERIKSRDNERKKHDLKNSEYEKEERIQEETIHQHLRTVKDNGKLIEKEEKDTREEEMKDTHIYNSDTGLDDFAANYEDDFEDYEDDFEDDEDKSGEEREAEENLREIPFSRTSEIEEIQRAISAENDRIFNSPLKKLEDERKEPIMENQSETVRNSFCGIFMDFQMANQRQSSRRMASKQIKRSSELLPLIDLDFSVSFSLLDLPPVNEYDMYIRNFGKMNTKQAYVQCNEDNLDRDIQTEEVETLEKWTQHPGESSLVSGGPRNSQDMSVNGALTPKIDSQRLANFLRSACQTEKYPAYMSLKFRDRHYFLFMDYLKRQVLCCCFSPSKTTLVFAGTIDGSLLVWDLREDSRMHPHVMMSGTDWTFRVPTFSTDGILNSVNHTSPVLAVEPVSTSLDTDRSFGLSSLSYQEEVSGPLFQIASMDENGILNMWVVVELQKVDLAGSQTDLGLVPGGKVKLVHSSTMELNNSLFPKDVRQRMPQTLTIKFLSSNPNHFVVGTNIVGCSDGSIRLHQMTSEYPVMQWNYSTNGQPVIALQWALTRPAVFFALDASSNIYIWDLLENDLFPVAKETVLSEKVVAMALLGEPEKANGLLGIVLAKEPGQIDIQIRAVMWQVNQSDVPREMRKVALMERLQIAKAEQLGQDKQLLWQALPYQGTSILSQGQAFQVSLPEPMLPNQILQKRNQNVIKKANLAVE